MIPAADAYLAQFVEHYRRIAREETDKLSFYRSLLLWVMAGDRHAYRAFCEQAIPALLKDGDWEGLHRLFFQAARVGLLPASSGYDHSARFWSLLDAAACEGQEVLRRALPPELGLTKNGYPMFVHGTNLLLCLLYNTSEEPRFAEERVLEQAEKYTKTKRPAWDRAVVAFLLCLHRRDPAGMTEQLQTVCSSYSRQNISKDKKLQCVNAYGLLVLAQSLLPEETFRRIAFPAAKNFSREYAAWRLSRTGLCSRPFFEYPAPAEVMNRILTKPVAVSRIFQPHLDDPSQPPQVRKTWYEDAARMLEEFIQDLPG